MQGANSKNGIISKVKSHIMSIVKVQIVALILFRIVIYHQMNKRHYI